MNLLGPDLLAEAWVLIPADQAPDVYVTLHDDDDATLAALAHGLTSHGVEIAKRIEDAHQRDLILRRLLDLASQLAQHWHLKLDARVRS